MSGLVSVPLASLTQYNQLFGIYFIGLSEKKKQKQNKTNDFLWVLCFNSKRNNHPLQQLLLGSENFEILTRLNNNYIVSTEKKTTAPMKKN